MNPSILDQEEKRIQIEPLPEPEMAPAPVPKKKGRPRTRPDKVETHVLTDARKRALEKARVVRRMKADERKAQEKLTAAATSTQGYAYGPQFDPNAALAMSAQAYMPSQAPHPAYSQNYNMEQRYLEQAEKMGRVETLLSQLLTGQSFNPNLTSQTREVEPAREVNAHQSLTHNKNPFISRRRGY